MKFLKNWQLVISISALYGVKQIKKLTLWRFICEDPRYS